MFRFSARTRRQSTKGRRLPTRVGQWLRRQLQWAISRWLAVLGWVAVRRDGGILLQTGVARKPDWQAWPPQGFLFEYWFPRYAAAS